MGQKGPIRGVGHQRGGGNPNPGVWGLVGAGGGLPLPKSAPPPLPLYIVGTWGGVQYTNSLHVPSSSTSTCAPPLP
jgi:hypothetical protein